MRVSLCQIASTSDPAHNLDLVADGIAAAAEAGSRLVVFPEAAQARFGTDLRSIVEPLDGPWAAAVRAGAEQAGVVVVVGMFTPAPDGRVFNTLLVTGAGLDTRYDKIHLFDALGHRESATVHPGERMVYVDVDDIRVGLATCFDVRFPDHFQALAMAGSQVVVVPSSWASGVGKVEQWEVLVRARALDATTWVLACDQADPTAAGVEPIEQAPGGVGHSLAVGPFGAVAGRLGEAPGVLTVEIDPAQVSRARQVMPVLDRPRHAPVMPG